MTLFHWPFFNSAGMSVINTNDQQGSLLVFYRDLTEQIYCCTVTNCYCIVSLYLMLPSLVFSGFTYYYVIIMESIESWNQFLQASFSFKGHPTTFTHQDQFTCIMLHLPLEAEVWEAFWLFGNTIDPLFLQFVLYHRLKVGLSQSHLHQFSISFFSLASPTTLLRWSSKLQKYPFKSWILQVS